MKVLCTCLPAKGHFHPMVPLAHAIQRAGHNVTFAVAKQFHSEVSKAGFEALPAGMDFPELQEAAEKKFADFSALPPDRQAAIMFTDTSPRALRDTLLPLARHWQPDLIVHEESEYGGAVVAAILGIPNVTVGWPAPARPPAMMQRLQGTLTSLWIESGLAPVAFGGMYRYLFLDSCPPSLQAEHASKLGVSSPLRPMPSDTDRADSPLPWLSRLSNAPTVHVTLGTVPVYNTAPHIFKVIIEGLCCQDVNVVVTIGENNDPASLEGANQRIFIERYVPHSLLLPQCDVVICHGGCGSTISALCYGLPLLLIPRGGAAQNRNALACSRAGVARILQDHEISAEAVRHHVRTLLDTREYKLAAEGIAREIEHMPHPAQAIKLLEQLSADKFIAKQI